MIILQLTGKCVQKFFRGVKLDGIKILEASSLLKPGKLECTMEKKGRTR